MNCQRILNNLTDIIEKEFGIAVLDPDLSLFSNNYNFSTIDILYIIYSYLNQHRKSIKIKPSMKKYSPNEISEWLLKNEL